MCIIYKINTILGIVVKESVASLSANIKKREDADSRYPFCLLPKRTVCPDAVMILSRYSVYNGDAEYTLNPELDAIVMQKSF